MYEWISANIKAIYSNKSDTFFTTTDQYSQRFSALHCYTLATLSLCRNLALETLVHPDQLQSVQHLKNSQ